MTPTDLRAICNSLNDERGTGGQSRLALLLGWHYSTIWRKLNGKSKITCSDELAIMQVVATLQGFPVPMPCKQTTCERLLAANSAIAEVDS